MNLMRSYICQSARSTQLFKHRPSLSAAIQFRGKEDSFHPAKDESKRKGRSTLGKIFTTLGIGTAVLSLMPIGTKAITSEDVKLQKPSSTRKLERKLQLDPNLKLSAMTKQISQKLDDLFTDLLTAARKIDSDIGKVDEKGRPLSKADIPFLSLLNDPELKKYIAQVLQGVEAGAAPNSISFVRISGVVLFTLIKSNNQVISVTLSPILTEKPNFLDEYVTGAAGNHPPTEYNVFRADTKQSVEDWKDVKVLLGKEPPVSLTETERKIISNYLRGWETYFIQ